MDRIDFTEIKLALLDGKRSTKTLMEKSTEDFELETYKNRLVSIEAGIAELEKLERIAYSIPGAIYSYDSEVWND